MEGTTKKVMNRKRNDAESERNKRGTKQWRMERNAEIEKQAKKTSVSWEIYTALGGSARNGRSAREKRRRELNLDSSSAFGTVMIQ